MADLSINNAQLLDGILTITGTDDSDSINLASDTEKLINTKVFAAGGNADDTVTLPFNPIYNLTSYTNDNGVITLLTNNLNTEFQFSNVETFTFSLFDQGRLESSSGVITPQTFFSISVEDLDAFVSNINLELNASVITSNPVTITSSTSWLIPTFIIDGNQRVPNVYTGLVDYLEYEYLGQESGEIVVGSFANEFFSLGAGDDAAYGGTGDDVLDGGTGSNFLTGGAGSDTFFIDGRSDEVTWSTIADLNNDDRVNIWGWVDGVSTLLNSEENSGAEGYKGVTLHYDLDNDGVVDTSITFSGLSSDELPSQGYSSVEGNGYLYFG